MAGLKLKARHMEWGIGIAVALLCVFFGFLTLVRPAIGEIATLHGEIKTSQKKLELYREITALKEEVARREALLANMDDRPILIAKLSDLASQQKVELQGLIPRTENADNYVRLRAEADMRCTYFALLNYLKVLEQMRPPVFIQDISMTQTRSGGRGSEKEVPLLQVRMIMDTYLRQKAGK